jgi:V/A-type H+-transporting ATPase subunit C
MARLDFANARIGGRRSRLAGARALSELLAHPSPDARLELARALPAAFAVPAERGDDPLGTVERGLRAGLRREALALLGDAEGRRPRALLAAFLALEEAAEVKAVLRGVATGAPLDRTLAAVDGGSGFAGAPLSAAAVASSLEGAIAALGRAGSPLAPALVEALPRAAEEGLLPLELAADRAALLRAMFACRGGGEDRAVLARHLSDLADARNATTLLALDGAVPAVPPWVPGGRRWDGAALEALARAGREAARAALAHAFALPSSALATPWSAERALERACSAALAREARARPLSIAVPLAYLAARREEIRRIALALRGAALGVPADELLDLVEV